MPDQPQPEQPYQRFTFDPEARAIADQDRGGTYVLQVTEHIGVPELEDYAEGLLTLLNGTEMPELQPYGRSQIQTRESDFPERKPSQLITRALTWLGRCEIDPRYTIRMSAYHASNGRSHARVGFAGAAMVGYLRQPIFQSASPEHFPHKIKIKLLALKEFSAGRIREALAHLHISQPAGMVDIIEMPSYASHPDAWKETMLDLAADLAAYGL